MRGILLLLCLVVCFLFGLLYGIDQDRGAHSSEIVQEEMEQEHPPAVEDSPLHPPEEVNLAQSDETSAYKMASALESIINFFYEIVIEILFQASKLFY